jgi:hypothetical protein
MVPRRRLARFLGGKLLYAVRVDTTLGFEICPADVCEIGDAMCPVGERPSAEAPRFQVVDGAGEAYTYDVNTNTNYNSVAEARAGRYGMRAIASFLGRELKALYNPPLSIAKPR